MSSDFGVEIQPTTISHNGLNLKAKWFVPVNSFREEWPGIILMPGYDSKVSRYDDRGKSLAKKGFLCLVFNYQGSPDDTHRLGTTTAEQGFGDATVALKLFLNDSRLDLNRVGVYGNSFGGYIAALHANTHPISALVLQAPALMKDEWAKLSLPEDIQERVRILRELKEYDKTKAIQSIEKYSGKLLVVEHEQDEIIPQEVTRAYYDHAKHTAFRDLIVAKDSTHSPNRVKKQANFEEIIVKWFVNNL